MDIPLEKREDTDHFILLKSVLSYIVVLSILFFDSSIQGDWIALLCLSRLTFLISPVIFLHIIHLSIHLFIYLTNNICWAITGSQCSQC